MPAGGCGHHWIENLQSDGGKKHLHQNIAQKQVEK
jgi:hypothetical protein